MIVCLASFLLSLIAMIFSPVLFIFNRSLAKKLFELCRNSAKCVVKLAGFQKCELRFNERIKNFFVKRTVVKYPQRVKFLATMVYVVSYLIVAGFVVGIVFLVRWILK